MTSQQLARKMRARAAAVEPEFRKTTHGLAVAALRYSKLKITELIYAFPVPKGKNGKPLWRRTGFLRRAERAEVRDAYTAAIVNEASYALFRHEAGKPGRRPTRYPAHWRDELREAFRAVCLDAYSLTVQAILKRGGL
jgi:hypothetical protein